MVKKIFFFICILILSSCVSISVFTDHDTSVDFSKYETYAFYKPSIDEVNISDLDKRRILKAVDEQMLSKNISRSSSPDLLVSISTEAKEKIYINSIANYAFWNPWFWGPSHNYINSQTEGTLYLNIIDSKSKQLVWQGKGKGLINEYSKNRDERIREFVSKILLTFPPQKLESKQI
ncbi:MAG: DUF4136 domain-containing protein [Bacteroidota bacterium]|nr:DUF4136 domain-containing protein [Bacteroidota bacterium]